MQGNCLKVSQTTDNHHWCFDNLKTPVEGSINLNRILGNVVF